MDSLKLMNHLRQELPIITTTSRRHKSTKIICDDEGYDNEFSPLYALFTVLDVFLVRSSGNGFP